MFTLAETKSKTIMEILFDLKPHLFLFFCLIVAWIFISAIHWLDGNGKGSIAMLILFLIAGVFIELIVWGGVFITTL